MSRRYESRGFWATWGLPLVAGPAITVGALAYIDATADRASGVAAALIAPSPVTVDQPLRPSDRFDPVPLGPPRSLPPPPAEPVHLYQRVTVLEAGRFNTVVGGEVVTIALAGIQPFSFQERCTDEKGVNWRCGGRARAEMAQLIGSRSVGCDPVEGLPATVQRCQVAGRDLAAWLVSQGWADPSDPKDPVLGPLFEDAKHQKRGRHGPAPLGVIAG